MGFYLRTPFSFLLFLALTFALTGCARTMWVKSGATPDDFRRDSYECERDARMGGYYGGGIAGAINMMEFQKRCLRARGYHEVPADATAVDVWK